MAGQELLADIGASQRCNKKTLGHSCLPPICWYGRKGSASYSGNGQNNLCCPLCPPFGLWLSLAFVSQHPSHLPPEIFALCNTRLVHTLRSMHILDALMATTSDVTRELWAQCPLLGTGEAILRKPQSRRSIVVSVRPAASQRRFAD